MGQLFYLCSAGAGICFGQWWCRMYGRAVEMSSAHQIPLDDLLQLPRVRSKNDVAEWSAPGRRCSCQRSKLHA